MSRSDIGVLNPISLDLYDLTLRQISRIIGSYQSFMTTLPCLGALALKFKTSPSPTGHLTTLPLLILCSSQVKASSHLQSLLTQANQISEGISDLHSVISQMKLTNQIAHVIDNDTEDAGALQHFISALLQTNDDIQTVLSPFTSIITTIRDAFAEEALDRFETLAEIMQVYQEFQTLQTSIQTLEQTFRQAMDENRKVLQKVKANLKIEPLQNTLSKLNQQKTAINSQIARHRSTIESLNQKTPLIQADIERLQQKQNNVYEIERDHPEQSDQTSFMIAKYDELIRGVEQSLAKHYQSLADAESRLSSSETTLFDVEEKILEVKEALDIKKESLRSLQEYENDYQQTLQKEARGKISELKDLAKATYSHLRILLDQAKATFNQKTNDEL